MKPLSVALLSHVASPTAPTGAERSLALLAQGMRERGHRVVVVTPDPSALEGTLSEAGVEVERIPGRACWLTYYEPRAWPVVLLKWIRYASPQPGAGRLGPFLQGCKPDVVHVNCLPHHHGARTAAGASITSSNLSASSSPISSNMLATRGCESLEPSR